jgi:cellulose synthase/poly-beta-1,6-N-acetylglucosamine synthase-like glycosyltransferase
MNEEWFINLRNLAFLFATLMLVKYFIFLVIAPFYSVKEELRKIKLKKRKEKYNPLVSVIVPAWNEEVGIKKTIKSLIENTHDRIEIIIVNDGSTDNSDAVIKDIIEKTEQDVRYKNIAMRYFYKENGGKGTALNLGIEKSKGEIIVTMDADSAFEKNTISNFVEYFTDKNIDAAVGNVKIANKRNIIGLLQRLEYLFGFYYKRTHAVLGAEYIFGGACAAFRREIFDNLGYFDIGNKTEDIEMSMRVRFHGLRCAYAENAVCWTEGASTIMGLINQRLRWKKGRLDTFIRYRKLFFSFDRKHNKALTFFVLPFSLLAELQLLYEPIAITLLLAYSFISGDFISLALGSLFIFVIYFVVAFFNDEKIDFKLLGLFFFTWPLFYILVWIEYLVLIKSLKMVLRGEDVSWQKWKRVGIDNI